MRPVYYTHNVAKLRIEYTNIEFLEKNHVLPHWLQAIYNFAAVQYYSHYQGSDINYKK
jgi:hypothetical protein